MENFIFYSPTKIFFGKKQEKNIGGIIKDYHYKKVLFVYGKSSIKKMGLYEDVINSLRANKIDFVELSGVEPNPKLSLVEKGIELSKQEECDMILAVGGGSVIDTAKDIACGFYSDLDPWLFSTHEIIPQRALPVGVILTISAAGSELSNSCVITNDKTNEKNGFNSDIIRPLFAVLNPELTYTVSKYQTACGIVDILMHTLERYLCDNKDVYFTDEVALGLLKSVIQSGKIAYNDPTNYDARASLMIASSFSHNGLTSLGVKYYFTVHRLEHELSGRFDSIAHGAGLAVLFPAWAKVVYKSLIDKFYRLAVEVFNVTPSIDKELTAYKGILAIEAFFREINMPTHLSELGVYEDSFAVMASRITKNNTCRLNGFINLDYNLIINIFNLAK